MLASRVDARPGRTSARGDSERGTHAVSTRRLVTVDGNEAAAHVAHALSEVIAVYPITPASPMGELADAWSAAGRTNIWGQVPSIVEMQSEAGAAGAVHGALLSGSLATTFTASQGLLLMLPNMFKIAGELTPAVIHVAARTVATHALSIFGDHSDVMAARGTGWAMLCSSSVQEAHDLALVAHAATLEARVPFLHFFDGFRTSHEINKIELLGDDDIRAMVDEGLVRAHRARALSPLHPTLRGSAQNPDVFFQAREAANPYHDAVAGVVERAMRRLEQRTGRAYHLVDYYGDPAAERVVVLMGSAAGATMDAVDALRAQGEKVGLAVVRLFRPFPAEALSAALPISVRSVAVLDRCKEPGAPGEPLYQDVVTALAARTMREGGSMPLVVGGRYGLSSKEFTPSMAATVLAELARPSPRGGFTVGVVDDVTHRSLDVDPELVREPDDVTRAVFYGLGSDGTVGANKATVKIIGEETPLHAQGYFVYDSKKSGTVTVSHLRFGPRPIRATYLVRRAGFVACHQFFLLERVDVLDLAAPGATFLLNSPYDADQVWEHLPVEVQEQIVAKGLRFFVVDAHRIAREAGLGGRVNTVLSTCFFELSGVLPVDEAIAALKGHVRRGYGAKGEKVVAGNEAAIDAAIAGLQEVRVPAHTAGALHRRPAVPAEAPDFVQHVLAAMIEGRGDTLPVSAMPPDGAFPTGTARWEKRSIATELPVWDPEICIDCAKCALVCPHAALRMKVYDPAELEGAPDGFQSKVWRSKEQPGMVMTIGLAPDDCTGCGICADYCPAKDKANPVHRSIDMADRIDLDMESLRRQWEFFRALPETRREDVRVATIKGSQMVQPLFEFSGACAGCGETPYLKLLTQMFGDRLVVANATGCSSIFGGNLPTTPWSVDADGHGPAWANSLFEDNAEFGYGIRLSLDQRASRARDLLHAVGDALDPALVAAILAADQRDDLGIAAQRARIAELRAALRGIDTVEARTLDEIADALVRTSVWIAGGDGWAYDIGYGGLDHVLASGRDVNILVLDTEVYSNTGGQASKSTPRGAVAKFAAAGKRTAKKDLGMIAASYGDVYVAHVALGADNAQTVKAFAEADAHRGVSLVIAYAHCIEHGIDMKTGMTHQKEAVDSGYWPLYRHRPGVDAHPFHLDSRSPVIPLRQFEDKETRFTALRRRDPAEAEELLHEAEHDVEERWHLYEQMAAIEHDVQHPDGNGTKPATPPPSPPPPEGAGS